MSFDDGSGSLNIPGMPQYGRAPKWLFQLEARGDLPAPALVLYSWLLLRYGNMEGGVFPSHATLAEERGSSDRTIRRLLQALASVGAVRWDRRDNEHGRTSNIYTIAWLAPYAFGPNGEIERPDEQTPKGVPAKTVRNSVPDRSVRYPSDKNDRYPSDKNVRVTRQKKNQTEEEPNGGSAASRRRRTTGTPGPAGSAAVRPVDQERLDLESVTWSRAARGVLESVRWLWDGPSVTAGRLADLGNLVDELVAEGASAAVLQAGLAALTAGVSGAEVRDGYVWLCLYGLPAAAGRPVDPCERPDCRYGFLEGQEGDQETARPCPACKTKHGVRAAAEPEEPVLVAAAAVPLARSAGPDLTELRASLAATRTSG